MIQAAVFTSAVLLTHKRRHTTYLRHTSSAAACTNLGGRAQAHTRPALSQELSLRNGGVDDAVDVSHRQELSTSSSYPAVAVSLMEFDPAQLERRHDALDSPSTLCVRVPSPRAWGRNSVIGVPDVDM